MSTNPLDFKRLFFPNDAIKLRKPRSDYFNSHTIGLEHQYGRRDVMWKRSMITFFKTSGNILDFPLTYINTIIGLDNRIVLNLACPRAPLAFLSHLKLSFPSLSNACHAG